jgi:hypothetical protein
MMAAWGTFGRTAFAASMPMMLAGLCRGPRS